MSEAPEQNLKRELTGLHVQLISLGGIIGSCYFLGIGENLSTVGPSTALSLVLGGLIVWMVAVGMGELCVSMPRTGSFVSYAGELVSRPFAAGVGWSYWLNWCAYVPSEMVAAGMIMNRLVPTVPTMVWAVAFGMFITGINLTSVGSFGTVESGLALLKVLAMFLFCVVGALVWSGVLGHSGFLGAEILTGGEGLTGLFPAGGLAVLSTMVMTLVNYQGMEIVALAAAETKNPEKNLPIAVRNVALRIVGIFVVPVLVLISILPHAEAGVSDSVFVVALNKYGLTTAALAFRGVILIGAVSCANGGLYGTIRALYGLSREGLAPSWFSRLNTRGVPARATWVTVLVCWAFIPFFVFFEGTSFYTWLLSVSGFTGAVCWISISWCQLRFRHKVLARGYTSKDLVYAAPGFPALSYASVTVQMLCLGMVVFSTKLRTCLVIGLPAVVIPFLVAFLLDRHGRLPRPALPSGERSFDELFPPKS